MASSYKAKAVAFSQTAHTVKKRSKKRKKTKKCEKKPNAWFVFTCTGGGGGEEKPMAAVSVSGVV
jgi:hypothetical protein